MSTDATETVATASTSQRSSLSLRSLYLDPNNFRFRDDELYTEVDEAKIAEADVQRRTTTLILGKNAENVRDLIESFRKNGFLP